MKCKELNNLIIDYIDGIFTNEQKKEFEDHLEKCKNCLSTYKYYIEVVKELQTLPKEKCPESVVERITDSISHKKVKVSFF